MTRAHQLHYCDDENCQVCRGGLDDCEVCGGGEASLPSECPGVRMSGKQMDAVQAGTLNYIRGAWREMAK
jgi:hypothetical protein